MTEPQDDLSALFARARQYTPHDALADERLIAHWRAQGRHRRQLRLGAWLAPLLASAALVAGVMVVQGRDLPSSTAYEVYQQASGSGW